MSCSAYNFPDERVRIATAAMRSAHPNDPLMHALAAHLDTIAAVVHDADRAESGDSRWTDALIARIRALLPVEAEQRAAIDLVRQAVEETLNAVARARAVPGMGDGMNAQAVAELIQSELETQTRTSP